VHDECALDRKTGERVGHELRGRQAERTRELELRRGRVRERPKDVEHRAHAHRLADRTDRLHRGVVVRREQKGELRGREAGACGLLIEG
jgi:hypothetical protein